MRIIEKTSTEILNDAPNAPTLHTSLEVGIYSIAGGQTIHTARAEPKHH